MQIAMGNSNQKGIELNDTIGCNSFGVFKSRPHFSSQYGLESTPSHNHTASVRSWFSSRSHHSTSSLSRPWSRFSRRRWQQSTLMDPFIAAKTAWPVPLIEAAFLPEFEINGEVNEKSFEVLGRIAKGAYGHVYHVRKQDNNQEFAMKVLSKSQLIAENGVEQVKLEVKIQSICGHHPFIVNCLYFWQSRKKIFIVSEYMPGGELLGLWQQYGALPEPLVQVYIAEIALAIDFLHNAGVIFRDLKLENILLDERSHAKLIDFGMAKWLKIGERTHTLCGTIHYMAPELMRLMPYGHAVDWWALGIIAYCLLDGQFPSTRGVLGECYGEDEDEAAAVAPRLPAHHSPAARDLVARLLCVEPQRRLRSLLALHNIAFFKGFSFDDTREMKMADKTSVFVRARPLFLSKEANCKNILQFPAGEEQILLAGDKGFEMDRVFSESCNQEDIFGDVKPIIGHVKQGYNAMILAYGQTGAGKTYTMGVNKRSAQHIMENDGIVPRIIQALFQECESDNSIQIFVTFMEVYNEEVYDLLSSVPTKLTIKGFKVQNLTEVAVHSEIDAFVRLEEGIEGRRFCATQANAKSSRSHAIFSLHLRHSSGIGTISSTLHLVDLAGSESVKRTGNQGVAFIEGININKGLLSLGKVIAARAGKQQGHVPFRDSVLTSVLKDSLCGMSYVTIIACISPSDADLQETLSTLRFVQRARRITNQPKINQAIIDNADKIKEFQSLLQSMPPTPASWKLANVTGRTGKGTPAVQRQRMPLSVINFSLPSPMMPRYHLDSSQLSHDNRNKGVSSPPLSLPNMSLFESSRCSSSLSYTTAKDQDISLLMNTLISEKMEELRTQTEELVERKVQDTLRAMKVAPLTSQLHRVSQNLSLISPTSMTDTTLLHLSPLQSTAACKLFASPGNRSSSPIVSKKSVEVGVDQIDEETENPSDHTCVPKRRRSMRLLDMHRPMFDSTGQESPDASVTKVNIPKKRRSMRIEELQKQTTLVDMLSQCVQPVAKKRRSSLSMRSYRSTQNMSCNTSQLMSPGTEEYLKEMQPSILKRRSSRRHSMADACQQTTPVREKKSRRSVAPVVITGTAHRKANRKSLSLTEKLCVPSPSRGNSQKKHNKNILNFLNTENMRGLQQLPTIGPKTAFIIFNFRKLHGPFSDLQALQKVPGLAKNYCQRFMQANSITL